MRIINSIWRATIIYNNPAHIPSCLIVKRIEVETDDIWFSANDVNQFRYENSIQSIYSEKSIRSDSSHPNDDNDKVNF